MFLEDKDITCMQRMFDCSHEDRGYDERYSILS